MLVLFMAVAYRYPVSYYNLSFLSVCLFCMCSAVYGPIGTKPTHFTTLILLSVFIRESQLGHPISSALVYQKDTKMLPASLLQDEWMTSENGLVFGFH